jgi:hypothetical protein
VSGYFEVIGPRREATGLRWPSRKDVPRAHHPGKVVASAVAKGQP